MSITTVFSEWAIGNLPSVDWDEAPLGDTKIRMTVLTRGPVLFEQEDYLDSIPQQTLTELLASPGWQSVDADPTGNQANVADFLRTAAGANVVGNVTEVGGDLGFAYASLAPVFATGFALSIDGGTYDDHLICVFQPIYPVYLVGDPGDDLNWSRIKPPPGAEGDYLFSYLTVLDNGSCNPQLGGISLSVPTLDWEDARAAHVWLDPQRINYVVNPSFEASEDGGLRPYGWRSNSTMTKERGGIRPPQGMTPQSRQFAGRLAGGGESLALSGGTWNLSLFRDPAGEVPGVLATVTHDAGGGVDVRTYGEGDDISAWMTLGTIVDPPYLTGVTAADGTITAEFDIPDPGSASELGAGSQLDIAFNSYSGGAPSPDGQGLVGNLTLEYYTAEAGPLSVTAAVDTTLTGSGILELDLLSYLPAGVVAITNITIEVTVAADPVGVGSSTKILESSIFPAGNGSPWWSVEAAVSGTGLARVGMVFWNPTLLPEETIYVTSGWFDLSSSFEYPDSPAPEDEIIHQGEFRVLRALIRAPENAHQAMFRLEFAGTGDVWVDNVLAEPNEAQLGYFDGDWEFGQVGDYSWYTGTGVQDINDPHKTYSIFYNNRRAVRAVMVIPPPAGEPIPKYHVKSWVPEGASVIVHWDDVFSNRIHPWIDDVYIPTPDYDDKTVVTSVGDTLSTLTED